MDQHLKDLFEREFAAEPPPPAGDLAGDVMRDGTRLRHRRSLLAAGGAAAGVLVVAVATVALGVPGNDRGFEAAGPAPARCTAVQPLAPADGEVAVFLRADVTDVQRTDIFDDLQSDPRVRGADFESKEQAYISFKRLWEDTPDLVKSVQPGQLPEAFRVTLDDPATSATFVAEMENRPGVEDVVALAGASCAPQEREGQ